MVGASAAGGNPPRFGGQLSTVGDRVRAEMAAVYRDHQIYEWLDGNGRQLLLEGRHTWPRLDLDRRFIVTTGTTLTVLPWVGDRTLYTAALALQLRGLETSKEGPALAITDAGSDDLRKAVDDLLAAG